MFITSLYSYKLFNFSSKIAIFSSVSYCFLRSFYTITGLALATNFSLLSFFSTETKKPFR